MASSDELLDDTNAEIPAESQDESKTEFLNRVKKIKSEINTKFQNARKKLDEKEFEILKRVEEIEKEVMTDYDKNAITLKEITQAKEQLLSTFKSNTTNILLKKNLEMFDKEIEEIKKNSKIDSAIELVWKMEQLNLSRDDMCEVSIDIKSSPEMPPSNMSPTHGHSSVMQSNRQNEPNSNDFNVASQPSSTYNHLRTYPQEPVGLNPPSGAGEWTCLHCTFVNSSDSNICRVCAKTPDFKVDQPQTQFESSN